MMVVDRWGNQVFSSDDPEASWDGRNQNKNIEMGVYLWMYDVEFLGCKEIIRIKEHGSVTIAR